MNDLSEPTYRIKLKKGDYEVEVQGDKAWVETKFSELTTTEVVKQLGATQPLTSPKTESSDLPESLAQFLKLKGSPKQHSILVVIFGYWLFHKENQKFFNVKDIAKCYDDTRITESNSSQYMNDAQGKGLFKRLDEKKDNQTAWNITQSGDEFVEKEQWTIIAGEQKPQKQDKRGGLRSSVVSPAIDELMAESFFKDFKSADQVCAELKRKTVPVTDIKTVNEALKRRVPKTLDRIKGEEGKWVYRRKP